MSNVVTRIPPSPTGHFHIGTARTALFNYLYARKHAGTVVFRSEDTDRTRSKPEFETEIIEGLAWLGITHDSFSRQSEHLPRHQELLKRIIAEDRAYISREEKKDTPGEMVEVVRLRNPGKVVSFEDEVRGTISFDTTELGDFVIARAIDDPLYHFAVVVDDMDAGITHVIRGEDHISNTPRQILIQEALDAPRPIYAHLPLILAPDRSKMSKRHGAVALNEYREEGFLPEAIVNYLGLLGWSPKSDREDFSLQELVEAFELSGVQKAGAVFDRTKFLSVNQRWLRKLSPQEFLEKGGLPAEAMIAVPLLQERVQTFKEAKEMLEGELSCLFTAPTLDREVLVRKEEAPGATKEALEGVIRLIEGLSEGVAPEGVKEVLMPYADEKGRAQVLWPVRYALSGAERSPDPFTLVSLLGMKESISRLHTALGIL